MGFSKLSPAGSGTAEWSQIYCRCHRMRHANFRCLSEEKPEGTRFHIQFIWETLYDKGHISFLTGPGSSTSSNRQADITENLTDFMALHLSGLSDNMLGILQTAACIGVKFDPDLIVKATDKPHAEITRIIAQAIDEGLLVSTDEGVKFAHDRVRDAAYMLLPEKNGISITSVSECPAAEKK